MSNHPFADPEPERLLTATDLAKRWSVSEAFVYRLAREGKIPVVRLGPRRRRFRLDAIEAFEWATKDRDHPETRLPT